MKYSVVLLQQDDGGYTSVVPALPGCVSEGKDVDEATLMAMDAARLMIESARDHEEEIIEEFPDSTLIAVVDLDTGRYYAAGLGGFTPTYGSDLAKLSREELETQTHVMAGAA